jgi:hypothetical protein
MSDEFDIKPCPFCGNQNDFYIGHFSAMKVGIQCRGTNDKKCGASIARSTPNEWPEGIEPGNLEQLDFWALLEAIDMWNQRSDQI